MTDTSRIGLEFALLCVLVLTVGQCYWTRWEGWALWSDAPAQCDVVKGKDSFGSGDSNALFDRYFIEHWWKSFLLVSVGKFVGLSHSKLRRAVYMVGLSFELWEKFSTRAHRGDSYRGDSVLNVLGDLVTNQLAGEVALMLPALLFPTVLAATLVIWGELGTTDFQSLHQSLRPIDQWNCEFFDAASGTHLWEFLAVGTIAVMSCTAAVKTNSETRAAAQRADPAPTKGQGEQGELLLKASRMAPHRIK